MLNYKVFGCPKVIYKSEIKDIFFNIGFYLGAIIILFNTVNSFIFFCDFFQKIRITMNNLMPNEKKLYDKAKEYKNKNKNNENIVNPTKKKTMKFKNKNSTNEINTYSTKEGLTIQNKHNRLSTYKLNIKSSKKTIRIHQSKKTIKIKESQNINLITTTKKLKEFSDLKVEENTISNNEEIKEDEYNYIPYSQALRLDKRNIFKIYLSIIKMRIDIISILCYPEEFSHKSLLLSIYALDFLFSYFMNAFLYTDDVVSQKYHNNGDLDLITSISLSLISNIVSSIAIWIIKKLTEYSEYLNIIVKDVQNERIYIYLFKKVYKWIKLKLLYFIY